MDRKPQNIKSLQLPNVTEQDWPGLGFDDHVMGRRPVTDIRTDMGRRIFAHRDFHIPECPRWFAVADPDAVCDCALAPLLIAVEEEAAALGPAR